MKIAIILAGSLFFCTASAMAQQEQIPSEFRGIWGWGAEACSTKDWRNKDIFHQIRPSDIEYWESECRVANLSRSSDDSDALVLRLNCSGEGEEWEMNEIWKKFDIGGTQYLIKVTLNRNEVRLYRLCR